MDERTASTPSVAVKQIPAKADRPKRRSWLKRIGIVLILLGIVSWFAPTIIARTVLKNRVPKMLVSMVHLNLEWSEVSLGWLSPVVIKNLKASDEEGRALVEVQQISTSQTLLGLATNSANLGTLKIVEPVAHVSLRNDGSNIEDLMAKFSTGTASPSSNSTSPSVIVEIENARIELDHKESNRKSSFEQIEFRFVSIKGNVEELDLSVGRSEASDHRGIESDDAESDWLTAYYGSRTDAESNEAPSDLKHAVLRASHWKLDRLAPGLARVMPKAELNGELNADATITLTPDAKGFDWDWNGTVSIEKLLVAGIEALKQDRLIFDQVALSGRAATTQGRLAINDLKLSADLGELAATGDFPLEINSKKSSIELVQSLLSDEDYHIVGHLDLKRLAAMLPQTLRIRDEIEITGGDVKVQLVGAESTGARRWSGAAGIVGLTALHQGQSFPWDKPLVARISAHREREEIIVDQLECKSDFLQIKGSGTLDDARFTATGDLSKLLENLERFVDLGIEQMSGQMKADGELRRLDDQQVVLNSKILLDNFAYVVSKNNVWRETHLELLVKGSGNANATAGLTSVETGEVHLISGGDVFDAKLLKPVDLAAKNPSYAAQAAVKGNLATWQNRLQPFVSVADWKLAGGLDLQTSVVADLKRVDVTGMTLSLAKLEIDGPGWAIEDPEMSLETAGQWDMVAQKWTSPKTSLLGTSVGLEIDGLECELNKTGLAKLIGHAEYRADLKAISHWMNAAMEKPSYYLIGSLTGQADVIQDGNVLSGKLETQIDKFVVAGLSTGADGRPAWAALWKEPQVKMTAKGTYDGSKDMLSVQSSGLVVDGLSVGAQGTLEACSTKQQLNLTGDFAYDWEALVHRFGDQLSANIQLKGKDHRPFSVKGSLASLSGPSKPATGKTNASTVSFRPDTNSVPSGDSTVSMAGLPDFSGEAGVGWTAANVYGIVAGPGDIAAKLENGICRFAPLDIAVNEGKLHLTPVIHLETDPFLLVLPEEKVIDQIRLSPELCSGWLKFVLPALADSAQVEGKFSLDVQGASVPLTAPATGTVDGTLSVHQVQVRPGPLALQIVGAIDQVQSILSRKPLGDLSKEQVWLEMPEQHIPFKLDQGRVHHKGMTFTVKNVAVKTSGSVGIDESLQLVAEIAIRDEWLGSNKIFQGLKGQTIKIPINGTLTRPQLDPRVFANLTQQMGGSLLEGVLKDQVGDKLDGVLNNGLDKLFRNKK